VASSRIADTIYTYRFLRMLTTPWEETDAFKLGIIDEDGKILKKMRTLKTEEEKKAYTMFHRLAWNLKRLVAKAPGGKSRTGSFAAALLLIKEEADKMGANEKHLLVGFKRFIKEQLNEEVPANVTGGGKVGGTENMRNTDEPLGKMKKRKKKDECSDKKVDEGNFQKAVDWCEKQIDKGKDPEDCVFKASKKFKLDPEQDGMLMMNFVDESVNEKVDGWIAISRDGEKLTIRNPQDAKSLYDAKKLAIKHMGLNKKEAQQMVIKPASNEGKNMDDTTNKRLDMLLQVAEASGGKKEYEKFMKTLLKKFGVDSPADLEGDKKKEFFDALDAGWEGDNEKPEPGDKKKDESVDEKKMDAQARMKQSKMRKSAKGKKAAKKRKKKIMKSSYKPDKARSRSAKKSARLRINSTKLDGEVLEMTPFMLALKNRVK